MYTSSFDEEVSRVKQSVDIVKVVGQYVRLKKAGAGPRFVGLCPLHRETTPSFGVHSVHQFYKCFGCGKGGDVFSFIQEIEGLSFYEALKLLADRAGVPLDNRPLTAAERRHFAQLRAAAERAAADLAGWRAWALYTLRYWRNVAWDGARLAQRWLESPAGRVAGWDHPLLLTALRAVSTGARLGDRLNDTLGEILIASPAEILELRQRMAAADRRAA